MALFDPFESATPQGLTIEKRKDYRNVVIVQIAIIISGFLLSTLLEEKGFISKSVMSLFSLFGLIYAFLLWDLLKDFTKSRVLVIGFFFLLAFLVVFGLLVEFPFYQVIEVEDKRLFFVIFHGCLFPIEATVIAYTIRDVFSGKTLTSDKLWGAACVYLMIGITFGSIYDFINVAYPGSLGAQIPPGWISYTESIYYSFNILGGLEPVYIPESKVVRNLGVLEAVWGNLYAILIIGKLLTRCREVSNLVFLLPLTKHSSKRTMLYRENLRWYVICQLNI